VKGMEQSQFLRAIELFNGSDIVRKFSFKMISVRGNCALLARANHRLAMDFAVSGDKSALIAVVSPVQAAISELTRGYSAHFQDCFECLSPHKIAA